MLNRLRAAALLSFVVTFHANAVAAQAVQRIQKEDEVVTYDGSAEESKKPDADILRDILNADDAIRTIVLTGNFEKSENALDVARLIDDFGLTTEISDKCTDACLYLFVAGKERKLAKGAKIGVRRRMLDAMTVREKFESRKARYGWEDEFGQAVMLYDIAQSDMRWSLLYLIDHGVTLEFALKVFSTPREDMWWPTQEEMIAGGVVEK